MMGIAVGMRMDMLPMFLDAGSGHQVGFCCAIMAAPVFVSVICLWHELQHFIGSVGSTVFLDKTCIHQANRALQREGIERLGAFLNHSSRMVAIYSEVYLTKLWTVYEVACFLSLHPTHHLTIIPFLLPKVFLGALTVGYIQSLGRVAFK